MCIWHLILALALFLVPALGANASPSQEVRNLARQGHQLLEDGEYSRAKWMFTQAYASMEKGDYECDSEFQETLANDYAECQIYLDDCDDAYLSFAYKWNFSSVKEHIRHLHLACLFYHHPIIIRALGKGETFKHRQESIEEATVLLDNNLSKLSNDEIRKFRIDIMNDHFEVVNDMMDEGRIGQLLKEYKTLAESVPTGDRQWPWLYHKLLADNMFRTGKTKDAVDKYVEVLKYCFEHNIENAYIPCISLCSIFIDAGKLEMAHEILLATARAIRKSTLSLLRKMTEEERYISWSASTTIRAYKILPIFPEGTYEDILYGAALYSKNVMMDIALEESDFVWSKSDLDFYKIYRSRNMLAGTAASRYAEWNFKDELLKRNPHWSMMEYSWTDVQSQLSDREMAVEIIRTGGSFENYTALLVRKDWKRPVAVHLCTESQLKSLGLDADLYRGKKSEQAYNLLVAPLEKFLKRGDTMYISPEGTLNAINFSALYSSDGSFASDKYELYRVTTTRVLPKYNATREYDNVYLFGAMDYYCSNPKLYEYSKLMRRSDPLDWFNELKTYPVKDISYGIEEDGTRSGLRHLEYTEKEISAIADMVPPGIEVHNNTGWMANEECFKKCCSPIMPNETSIYHIATHSFVMPADDSMKVHGLSYEEIAFKQSGLMFSGAGHTVDGKRMPEGVNDGMLYAEEIAALDMRNADMVVLSACNTALGEYSLNGVMGLQRAFKKAGCKTIVMTLWKVNDRVTSVFMTTFYKNLFAGSSKYKAFSEAQIAVRAQYEDPYYWAPFIMLD